MTKVKTKIQFHPTVPGQISDAIVLLHNAENMLKTLHITYCKEYDHPQLVLAEDIDQLQYVQEELENVIKSLKKGYKL